MHEDGTMMRLPSLVAFAQEKQLPILTIEDIAHYRLLGEQKSA